MWRPFRLTAELARERRRVRELVLECERDRLAVRRAVRERKTRMTRFVASTGGLATCFAAGFALDRVRAGRGALGPTLLNLVLLAGRVAIPAAAARAGGGASPPPPPLAAALPARFLLEVLQQFRARPKQ